jgi:hypothetical protein
MQKLVHAPIPQKKYKKTPKMKKIYQNLGEFFWEERGILVIFLGDCIWVSFLCLNPRFKAIFSRFEILNYLKEE